MSSIPDESLGTSANSDAESVSLRPRTMFSMKGKSKKQVDSQGWANIGVVSPTTSSSSTSRGFSSPKVKDSATSDSSRKKVKVLRYSKESILELCRLIEKSPEIPEDTPVISDEMLPPVSWQPFDYEEVYKQWSNSRVRGRGRGRGTPTHAGAAGGRGRPAETNWDRGDGLKGKGEVRWEAEKLPWDKDGGNTRTGSDEAIDEAKKWEKQNTKVEGKAKWERGAKLPEKASDDLWDDVDTGKENGELMDMDLSDMASAAERFRLEMNEMHEGTLHGDSENVELVEDAGMKEFGSVPSQLNKEEKDTSRLSVFDSLQADLTFDALEPEMDHDDATHLVNETKSLSIFDSVVSKTSHFDEPSLASSETKSPLTSNSLASVDSWGLTAAVSALQGPPPPPPILQPPVDAWFYLDPQGNQQGPFKTSEMKEWFDAGYFKPNLPVRRGHAGRFLLLATTFSGGRSPFVDARTDPVEMMRQEHQLRQQQQQFQEQRLARQQEQQALLQQVQQMGWQRSVDQRNDIMRALGITPENANNRHETVLPVVEQPTMTDRHRQQPSIQEPQLTKNKPSVNELLSGGGGGGGGGGSSSEPQVREGILGAHSVPNRQQHAQQHAQQPQHHPWGETNESQAANGFNRNSTSPPVPDDEKSSAWAPPTPEKSTLPLSKILEEEKRRAAQTAISSSERRETLNSKNAHLITPTSVVSDYNRGRNNVARVVAGNHHQVVHSTTKEETSSEKPFETTPSSSPSTSGVTNNDTSIQSGWGSSVPSQKPKSLKEIQDEEKSNAAIRARKGLQTGTKGQTMADRIAAVAGVNMGNSEWNKTEKGDNGGNLADMGAQLRMMLGVGNKSTLPTASGGGDSAWKTTSATQKKLSVREILAEEQAAARANTTKSTSSAWARLVSGAPLQSHPTPKIMRDESKGKDDNTMFWNLDGIKTINNGGLQGKVTSMPTSQMMMDPRKERSKSPINEFGVQVMSGDFMTWCSKQLKKLVGSEDMTLVHFCLSLEDPGEIREYIATYLGSTPEVSAFASEFIRRKNQHKEKGLVPASSPSQTSNASAISEPSSTSNVAIENLASTNATKKTKKKRKGQKVDASFLGYSVSSSRPNQGEIDYGA